MKKITRKAIACAMALASAISFAADIAVGKWERRTLDDDTPAFGVGEGLYLCEKAASLSYVGPSAWTLSVGNLFAFGNAEIGVRSGTLRISNSAGPDLVANPPAELQKAALWLDAEKNVQTTEINSTTYATGWFDAREPSAAASSHGYAEASSISTDSPIPTSFGDKTCVGFRGYKDTGDTTARSFVYKATDGTETSYEIRHAFFVVTGYSIAKTAPVLGHKTEPNFFSGSYAMLSTSALASPLAYASEYLLDGVPGDPAAGISADTTHLHEFTLPPNRTIAVDSLMRDRNLASGGLRVHEILLFTQRLTVQERMRISAYLMEKWSCDATSSFAVRTTKGTDAELPDGELPNSTRIAGEGSAVVASGACAEVAHLYPWSWDARAQYSLRDGISSLALQATEYEYRLAPCDQLTAAASDKLTTVTKSASGLNGRASVSSSRRFVVSKLDSAITNLALSGGGDHVLRAPSDGKLSPVPGTAVTATFSETTLSVPVGNVGVEVTVEVPVDGDWELGFKMYNDLTSDVDSEYGDNGAYRVRLISGDSVVWERIPTVLAPAAYGNVDQVRRYLVRNLLAGTYKFRVAGYETSARAASLSDLSMVFVPNVPGETVVPVADGDFESSRFRRPYYAAIGNNTRTEWTLDNGTVTQNPPKLTILSSAMGYSGSDYDGYMFRSTQLGRYGDNALVWFHTGATATSPATALSAGTYKLRLDAVRWTTGTKNHKTLNSRCNAAASVAASVAVNGGEPIALGVIGPVANFTVESLSFPSSFTVSEGDNVVVTLNQTNSIAAVQLDNLEFVKVADAESSTLGEELIVNGSVEDGTTGWSFDDWTDGFRRVAMVKPPTDYGPTKCDGDNVIRTANGGRAYQYVSLPAGVFRLSWWSRARWVDGKIYSPTALSFWYAADGAATTNEIVTSETSWCTNFLEHVAYFSVPAAGSYVLGFNSEEANGKDAVVDCVSVRQVLGPETVPDVAEHTEIRIADGGKLRLDYNGCLKLGKIRVGGKSLTGEVSATTYPDHVCGPGRAFVEKKGFVLTFR